ncbi:MAG: AraC family transcriptional regulator [Clostridiales Family XIII bacterium]|jgi:AraC-like DNA-binding protein|nr:AraC family transcriptional regulator [Clostridiales Family XIII bacterium]
MSMFVPIPYENNLPVHVTICRVKNYPLHCHEDIQIVYVLDGEIDLRLTHTIYRIRKNDIHFIHAGDMHSIEPTDDENLVLMFSIKVTAFEREFPTLVEEIFTTRVKGNVATWKRQIKIRNDIFSVSWELHARKPGFRERVNTVTEDMIRTLYADFRAFRINREEKTFEHVISSADWLTERFSRIIAYLYREYPYRITLGDIAASENINRYHLSHTFALHIGVGFRDFLNMVRAEMSEYELLASDIPISRIANNSGFSDKEHYVKCFTEWFGVPPETYRQKYAGTTIRHSKPRVEILPPEEIGVLLGDDASGPVGPDAIQSIRLSVKGNGAGRTADIPCSALTGPQEDDYAKRSFAACIRALDRIGSGKGSLCVDRIAPYDSVETRDGLFTSHGLPTPMYYLYEFLAHMFDDIINRSRGSIVTVNGVCARGILYKPRGRAAPEYNLSFPGRTGRYVLRLQYLTESGSSISMWRKLCLPDAIIADDFRMIERASYPTTEILPIDDITKFELKHRPENRSIMYFQLDPQHGSY